MRRSGKSMKELLNECLRLALNSRRETPEAKPFRVRAASMGTLPGLNSDNIGEILERVEGPVHR
jgi:hypothetical protein